MLSGLLISAYARMRISVDAPHLGAGMADGRPIVHDTHNRYGRRLCNNDAAYYTIMVYTSIKMVERGEDGLRSESN
jgi:hypothetical protein